MTNSLLLYPSRDPIPVDAECLTVPSGPPETGGGHVEAFYQEYGPEGEVDFFVLSLTGNGGRAEWMPEYTAQLLGQCWSPDFPEKRFGVLGLQYPGYGRSTGPPTLKGLGAASLAGYSYLHERAAGKPILVHGLSLGTTAALHVTRSFGQDGPTGLILEKPPNLWSQILRGHGWWNLWLLALPVALGVPESARSDLNARKITDTPALFILADHDEIVPFRYARSIFDRYQGSKRMIRSSISHNQPVKRANTPDLPDGLRWIVEASRGPIVGAER